ncbi:hypothetical protein Dimus_017138 [Dionaea muscipula]
MIMLENQIPLFVLDKLLSFQPGMSTDQKSVAPPALEFFERLTPADPLSDESGLHCHCLDIFRSSLPKEEASSTGPPPPDTPLQYQRSDQHLNRRRMRASLKKFNRSLPVLIPRCIASSP